LFGEKGVFDLADEADAGALLGVLKLLAADVLDDTEGGIFLLLLAVGFAGDDRLVFLLPPPCLRFACWLC